MRRATAPFLFLLLLIAINNSSSSFVNDKSPDRWHSSDAFPQTPSLQSIIAQPKSVAVLLDAAVHKLIRAQVFSNWTLSALRHTSRENDGLPHVLEWINEELPQKADPSKLYSRPFVVGGVIWHLYVQPSHVGSTLQGWRFYLRAILSAKWDDDDYVNVALGVSMPQNGRGFEAQEGLNFTFARMGNEYTVREVAYLPAPTRLCSEASHNSTGTDETVDCVHDLNTEPRRSHILRLNFTRVAPSWAVVDNGQRHTEAQYYRACERYWRMLSIAHAHGMRRSFRFVQRSLQHLGSIVHNEYHYAGRVFNDESWFELLTWKVRQNVACHLGWYSPKKAAAVLAMITLKTGEGDIEEAAQLVEALQDPSAEGGVRYEDRSDGEELARYGTECTTGSTQGAILHDVGAAIRHVRELNAFYDGLWDPEAQKTETHKQRAKAVVEKLMAVVAKDLEGSSDWGEDWYKMRDAQCNKLALLTPYQESGYDGLSCLVRLPPQGSTQVLQWTRYSLYKHTHVSHYSRSAPFVAGGLVWTLILRFTLGGFRMDLVPYGDLHRDIKAVHGTARYELLSGHLDGTGLPAATVGNGTFVINATSPSLALWSVPSSLGARPRAKLLPNVSSDIVVRLYLDAWVDWQEHAVGRERAVHEAAFEQLHLLRIADHLNVGQRFRKTVRLGTLVPRTGNKKRHTVLLKRNETYYDVIYSHELYDKLVYENLLCLTGSEEIAQTKRSAVYDMSLLRSLRNDNPLWEQRAVHAPKVVVLRPDIETTSSSPNSSSSRSSSDADEDGYHVTSVRYLDEYGHDVTPYYKECTTDLEGLQYDLAFGEDLTRAEVDNGAALCWWLSVATVCIRTAVTVLSSCLDTLAVVGVCFLPFGVFCWMFRVRLPRLPPFRLGLLRWTRGQREVGGVNPNANDHTYASNAGGRQQQGKARRDGSGGESGKAGPSPQKQQGGKKPLTHGNRRHHEGPSTGGGADGAGLGFARDAKGGQPSPKGRVKGVSSSAGGSSLAAARPSSATAGGALTPSACAGAAAGRAAAAPGVVEPWSLLRWLRPLLVAVRGAVARQPPSPAAPPPVRLATPAAHANGGTPAPRASSKGQLANRGQASHSRQQQGQEQQPEQQHQAREGLRFRQRQGNTGTPGAADGAAIGQQPAPSAAAPSQQAGGSGSHGGRDGGTVPSKVSLASATPPAPKPYRNQQQQPQPQQRQQQQSHEEEGRAAVQRTRAAPSTAAGATVSAVAVVGVAGLGARGASAVEQGGHVGPAMSEAVAKASAGGQPAQEADGDEEEAVCLVCHDGPRQWGFLHGATVHMGVCGGCRELVRARAGAGGAVACPVCREPVDTIIKLIQA